MNSTLSEQVEIITHKVEQTKASIYLTILKEYDDLFPCKTQDDLLHTVKPLLKEMQKIEDKFQSEVKPLIQAALTQHKDLVEDYNNTKVILELLQTLCKCHKELSLGKKNTSSTLYVKSATHLQNVKKELDSINKDVCEIKMFKLLRNEYISQQEKLMNSFDDIWNSVVIWTTSLTASWDTFEGHLKTSLKVDSSPSDGSFRMKIWSSENLADIIGHVAMATTLLGPAKIGMFPLFLTGRNGNTGNLIHVLRYLANGKSVEIDIMELITSMNIMEILNARLKSFSQKVFTYLLKPMLKFQNLVASIQSLENKSFILKITKKTGNQKISRHGHLLLYKKILDVVRFLKKSLFSQFYNENEQKYDIDPLGLIGSYIWKDLSDMIIKDYLSTAVPYMNTQMEKFESTIKETIGFELELIKEGFVPSGTNSLSKYVKDVNIHFANKVCQDILSQARDLMVTELHNAVEVDLKLDRAAISLSVEEKGAVLDKKVKNMLAGVEAIEDELINVNIFAFPHCYISENVQRLIDFIYHTMIKATESPYPLACQIFYSCRDIFELFVNVVPTYHKENLKLPQLAALHYNNCMYLSHHCITLGHQFRNSLPDKLNSAMATFIDYVHIVRKCGTDCFLEQLRSQQRELLNILEDCHHFVGCESTEQAEPIKKAFNQVIHYLTRLTKQWDKILPVHIFKQSIAILFNTVLENILTAIFKMEDISADEAGQLHALFSMLISRAPEMLQSCASEVTSNGVYEHIRSWKKFGCLIKILEASLQEVVDMWGHGDDELAMCMTDGEVRNLIRALFQNTDRRAQALAKIKHQLDNS